jgi:hypothetical protein
LVRRLLESAKRNIRFQGGRDSVNLRSPRLCGPSRSEKDCLPAVRAQPAGCALELTLLDPNRRRRCSTSHFSPRWWSMFPTARICHSRVQLRRHPSIITDFPSLEPSEGKRGWSVRKAWGPRLEYWLNRESVTERPVSNLSPPYEPSYPAVSWSTSGCDLVIKENCP